MAIRWVSNPESIKANQPSVLAIAETLAAMGVSVWIAVTWQTYIHIAIGASIAPFLLMRTDESGKRCSEISGKLHTPIDWLGKKADQASGYRKSILEAAWMLLMVLWTPTLFLVGRLAAWVATVVRHPLVALVAVPGNWRYATVVLDSKKWPEVMPAPRKVPESVAPYRGLHAGQLIELVRDIPGSSGAKLGWLIAVFITSLLVVPAFAYRWSLKSTALIWFPLLWAMRSVRQAGESLPDYLSAYVRKPLNIIVLCVSIGVIVTFLGKIILWSEWSGFVEWWNAAHWRSVLSLYVTPQEIQWWQVAMFANSIIAIAMYLLAVQWLVSMKYRQITNETLPRRVFQVGLFIRPILSGYTIACTLYITIRAASDWELPALGTRLFPWM